MPPTQNPKQIVVDSLIPPRVDRFPWAGHLVRGNHDDRAGDPPDEWGIECQDEPVAWLPFVWRHEPAEAAEGYVLAGHVHPAVHLSGAGGLSATLPCFYFGAQYGLLPAFGDFTGTAVIRPRRGDRVFVLAEGMVLPKV